MLLQWVSHTRTADGWRMGLSRSRRRRLTVARLRPTPARRTRQNSVLCLWRPRCSARWTKVVQPVRNELYQPWSRILGSMAARPLGDRLGLTVNSTAAEFTVPPRKRSVLTCLLTMKRESGNPVDVDSVSQQRSNCALQSPSRVFI